MAVYSVTNSLSLRQAYRADKTLSVSSTRKETKNATLNFADATALRNQIRKLKDMDFEDLDEDSIQEKLQAFVDTHNMALDSTSSSTVSSVKNASNKIKKLDKEYADELEKIGISIDSKGYMTLSESAAENLSGKTFNKFFSRNEDYLTELQNSSRRIRSSIDVYL